MRLAIWAHLIGATNGIRLYWFNATNPTTAYADITFWRALKIRITIHFRTRRTKFLIYCGKKKYGWESWRENSDSPIVLHRLQSNIFYVVQKLLINWAVVLDNATNAGMDPKRRVGEALCGYTRHSRAERTSVSLFSIFWQAKSYFF